MTRDGMRRALARGGLVEHTAEQVKRDAMIAILESEKSNRHNVGVGRWCSVVHFSCRVWACDALQALQEC